MPTKRCSGCKQRTFRTLAQEVMATCTLCGLPYCALCVTGPPHADCTAVKDALNAPGAGVRLASGKTSLPQGPSRDDCAF